MTDYCQICGLPRADCICPWEESYEGVCPRCNAIWGMDEVDRNRCYACGWPEEEIYGDDDWPTDDELPDEPIPINRIAYQPVLDMTCPYCETPSLFTDEGLDDEGFPIGMIYCVKCNRQFEQAIDVRAIDEEEQKPE